MPALTPHDCLFPLPVEEHAISVLPGNARDGLSSLPVEEKAISGSTGAQERPFSDDSGCRRFDPSRLHFPPQEEGKRQIASRFCLFAIACSLYLANKRQFKSSPSLNSTYPQTASFGGALNSHGLIENSLKTFSFEAFQAWRRPSFR